MEFTACVWKLGKLIVPIGDLVSIMNYYYYYYYLIQKLTTQ